MKLSTCLHPVIKLRIKGAVPLVALYAFMMWTGIFFFCIALWLHKTGGQTDIWREAAFSWPNIVRTNRFLTTAIVLYTRSTYYAHFYRALIFCKSHIHVLEPKLLQCQDTPYWFSLLYVTDCATNDKTFVAWTQLCISSFIFVTENL